MYFIEDGVTQDFGKGYFWIKIVYEKGHEGAAKFWKEFELDKI